MNDERAVTFTRSSTGTIYILYSFTQSTYHEVAVAYRRDCEWTVMLCMNKLFMVGFITISRCHLHRPWSLVLALLGLSDNSVFVLAKCKTDCRNL